MKLHTRPLKRTLPDGTVSGAGVSLVEEIPGVVVIKVPFLGGGWMAHDVVATGEFTAKDVLEVWGEKHDKALLKKLWEVKALHQINPTKQQATEDLARRISGLPEDPTLGDLLT